MARPTEPTVQVSDGLPGRPGCDASGANAGSADPVAPDLDAPPFAETGVGGLMFSGAHDYRAEYVLSTEGADHQPTEFEAWLLEDFVAGLMSDERFFGPVRALLARALELRAMAPHPAPSSAATGNSGMNNSNNSEA